MRDYQSFLLKCFPTSQVIVVLTTSIYLILFAVVILIIIRRDEIETVLFTLRALSLFCSLLLNINNEMMTAECWSVLPNRFDEN